MIIKSVGSEIKVRSKVLLVKGDTSYAVCRGCGTEIPVPLVIDMGLAKSMAQDTSSEEPRLFLRI